MSGDPVSRTPNSQDSVPAEETGPDMGVAPDCPSAEGSENMSVTNSEVEGHFTKSPLLKRGVQCLQLG